MTENWDDTTTEPEAGQLTPEEESVLIQDTSAENGDSDYPDPPQDNEEFDGEEDVEEWADLDEADDDLDVDFDDEEEV